MAKGHGGARKGAGRKPKADEERIRRMSIEAIQKVFGSEPNIWLEIAKQAKESFPHLKLLMDYTYGKPKEYVDVTSNDQTIGNTFNLADLTDEQLEALMILHGRYDTDSEQN